MARGNQRDKAREKNQKDLAAKKGGTTMSGAEMMREKDKVTAIMQAKQAAAAAKKEAEGKK